MSTRHVVWGNLIVKFICGILTLLIIIGVLMYEGRNIREMPGVIADFVVYQVHRLLPDKPSNAIVNQASSSKPKQPHPSCDDDDPPIDCLWRK